MNPLDALESRVWAAWQSRGLPGVLRLLGGTGKAQKAATRDVVEMLRRLALRLRKAHPAAALEVVQALLTRAPGNVPGLLLAAALYQRTGDSKQSAAMAARVVQNPQAQPAQRLHALGLLGHDTLDVPTLDAAKRLYASLGRPLTQADTLLDLALRAADWDLADEIIAQLRQARADGVPEALQRRARTHLLWCDDEVDNIAVVTHSAQNLVAGAATAAGAAAATPMPQPLVGRRLRVGYLSSDFREHPTSRLLLGLLRHHDMQRFEVHLYCSGWDDGSALRQALAKGVEHFVSLQGLSDAQAAERIRADGIDVLVELNGPTLGSRMGILAHRPAPVQIEYLGWPGSVGGQLAEYVVADAYTVPTGRGLLYPEKLIRIHRVYQVNDYAAATKRPPPPRALFNLPEGRPVLGSFNQVNKLRNEVWAVWMRIMRAVPDAVLWMLDPGPVAQTHVQAAAAREGVAPERVVFAPRCGQGQHLSRLQHCDLMLDPWPYGGHTTTSDALHAGVPVVALRGRNFAGRVSGALLHAAGLEALVQPDTDRYVECAVQILTDAPLRERLRQFLRDAVPVSDVFNARDKARQFEAAYLYAVQAVLNGKPPETLDIEPRQSRPQPVFHWPGPAQATRLEGEGIHHMTTWEVPAFASPAPAPAVVSPEPAADVANVAGVRDSAAPEPGASAVVGTGVAVRPRLVLVCGPLSSGSSAVAGLLANAGLQAPGPYFPVNDPRTAATYEMQAFRRVLNTLASEQTLQRTASKDQALQALKRFRDEALLPVVRSGEGDAPVMLKHGLAMLFLPELSELFDLRVVGVLRPLQAIEATRVRRGWHAGLGQRGAQVLYEAFFAHIVDAATPFHLLRYPELLSQPDAELGKLMGFCDWSPSAEQRTAALGFVRRG